MQKHMADNSTSFKVRENRLRRMADRQGVYVRKTNPSRDPRAINYRITWELLRKDQVVAGPFYSLEELESALVYDISNPPEWVRSALASHGNHNEK